MFFVVHVETLGIILTTPIIVYLVNFVQAYNEHNFCHHSP